MRIMRSNYDKARRCPNWSGPAFKASDDGCPGGMLNGWYELKHPQWHFMKCEKCGTWVLPNVLRNLDPSWWKWRIELRKWR